MSKPPSREEELFVGALALPSEERTLFLANACGSDATLRARVEALLLAHDEAGNLLDVAPGGAVRAALSSPLPEEKPGTLIGRYKLLQKIGEGGCGVVYMAEQEEPVRRRVALKVIKLGMDTREVVARFEAERQALALMDHPNIARVLDAGATDTGRPFFVMELVRGVPITKYCDENNLPTPARLELFTQVCQAVQHAHQKGIIHRDLKPSNILVTVNDGAPLPKVIDFGIAKATQGRLTDRTLFTAFEQFIGTPAYMSPEQAEMSSVDVDTRSDIYSLGVLLYELLTGQTPFDAKSLVSAGLDEIRRVIREVEPPKPSARLSTLTDADRATVARLRGTAPAHLSTLLRGDLDWIVMRCLEKDRRRRYETANGLAMDLQRHLSNEPVVARPPSKAYRFRKMVRRHRLAFAAGVIVVAALLAGLILSAWALVRERAASQRAEAARAQAERLVSYLLKDVRPTFEQSRRGPLLERLAREALLYYDQLPAELRDAFYARNRAIALEVLAGARLRSEDNQTTRDAFREAVALRRRVLKAVPSDVDGAIALLTDEWWSFWYSHAAENPALNHATRWPVSARTLLEKLIGQARELRVVHPDNTDVTVCLASLLDRLAWHCTLGENNPRQAIIHFTEAINLTRDALARKPNDAALRLQHGWSLSDLANGDESSGNHAAAVRDSAAAVAFAESASATDPGNIAFLELSAVAARRLADGLYDNRSPEQKRDAERVVRERYRILTQLDPTNLDWRRRFAIAHQEEGRYYKTNGQYEEARMAFQKFRTVLEPIAAATNQRGNLVRAIGELGWLAAAAGDKDTAQRYFREAWAVYQTHVAARPENRDDGTRGDLEGHERGSYEMLGWYYYDDGYYEKAREAFLQARTLLESASAAAHDQAKLALAIIAQAIQSALTGDRDTAQKLLGEARAAYQVLHEELPTTGPARALAQAELLTFEPLILRASNDWAALEVQATATIGVINGMLTVEKENPALRLRRVEARNYLAQALVHQARPGEAIPLLKDAVAELSGLQLTEWWDQQKSHQLADLKELLAEALLAAGQKDEVPALLEPVLVYRESQLAQRPRLGSRQVEFAQTALLLVGVLDPANPVEAARRQTLLDRSADFLSHLAAENRLSVRQREMLPKVEALRATSSPPVTAKP